MRINKIHCGMLAIFFLSVFTVYSAAQDCSKYYGKGYCTDYIKQQKGQKPSGDAGDWQTNIDVKSVKQGDVAIFGRSRTLKVGHVAIVERVIYERNTDKPYQVDISEWNWGPRMVDAQCSVTNMFGKITRRTVLVSALKGFWRP